MLKKQTVWLLTMLSLMIVLSVYYIFSDKDDLAYIDSGKSDVDETVQTDLTESDSKGEAEVDQITNVGQDELFTTIRLELQNERSMQKSSYEDIVTSNSATIDEKNEALENIHSIDQSTTKENILQNSILAVTADYQDVLVRANEDIVHVHIKTNELSNDEVVHIMQLVRDEFGDIKVDVNVQPIEG
jgi:stage III sporulation protein AH